MTLIQHSKLINLAGPPACGKSFHATRFVKEFPKWDHLSIDNYRINYRDEEDAWYNLMKDVVKRSFCLLESSGLSWRLKRHILNHPVIRRRGYRTIIFNGDIKTFDDRLTERQITKEKREVPFAYDLDEHQSIIYTTEKLPKEYKKAVYICTDNSVDQEVAYRKFKIEVFK